MGWKSNREFVRYFSSVVFVLVFYSQGKSQALQNSLSTFEIDSMTTGVVHVFGSGYVGYKGIKNTLAGKFLFGGFIDEIGKTNSLKSLKQIENKFGGEGNLGLRYVISGLKLGQWSPTLTLEHIVNFDGNFSKNMFQLAFFGNKKFLNTTAQLGPAHLNSLQYQKLGIGLINRKNRNFFQLSMLKGQSMNHLFIDQAHLASDSLPTDITLQISGKHDRSDTTLNNWKAFNGFGTALDFQYNFGIQLGGNQHLFVFEVQNAGVLIWNEKSESTKLDTTYNYQGFNIFNLAQSDGFTINQSQLEDSVLPNYSSRQNIILLPTNFILAKQLRFDSPKKWQSLMGIRYRLNTNYIPRVYAGAAYSVSSMFYISSIVSYGGYSGLNGGLRLDVRSKGKFNLYVASNNILGFVPSIGEGYSLNCGMICSF